MVAVAVVVVEYRRGGGEGLIFFEAE